MADKDIIDFNKSQFDIMVDMLVRSGMSKDDAIVKVTKDFEDEGMVLKNRGGMMDIDRMTAPLGYALGGPAGMMGSPTSDPESYEGFEPILGNWMKEARMRQAQPPAGAVDMTGQYVAPQERPPWDKARKLGKKAVKGIGEGIKGLGSKSIDVLRKLLGSKAAEAGTYIPDSVLEEMTIEELVKEIQLFDIGLFGNPVRPNDISHLRELTDALEKQMGKYK